MKEVLGLLNNSNPDGTSQSVLLQTLCQWLRSSPHSILLTPCIKASSRCLASLTQMVQVTETCIEVYFTACKFVVGVFLGLSSSVFPSLSLPSCVYPPFLPACVFPSFCWPSCLIPSFLFPCCVFPYFCWPSCLVPSFFLRLSLLLSPFPFPSLSFSWDFLYCGFDFVLFNLQQREIIALDMRGTQ